MWGIGIKKDYDINVEYVSIKDNIYNEDSLVKTFLVIFGLPFQIWEKKFKSINKIRGSESVGFNK